MTRKNATIGCKVAKSRKGSAAQLAVFCGKPGSSAALQLWFFVFRRLLVFRRFFVCCVLILFLLPLPLFAEDNNGVELREWTKWSVPPEMKSAFTLEPSLAMPRQQFERLVRQFEQRSEEQSAEHPYLSQIVLHARLDGRQLTDGQGIFTLHPRTEGSSFIPLSPLPMAVHSLQWGEGEEAILFHEPASGYQLLVPSKTDSNLYNQLQFQWSLQSRRETRNGTVFDLALPPCMSIELHIDMPETLTLTASAGLVLPGVKENDSGYRTWCVLLGHHSMTTLTITEDKTLPSVKPRSAISQRVIYAVRPEGLAAQTFISFDRVDTRPSELVVELEMPLRPTNVTYGNQPAPWIRSAISPEVSEVRIDLTPFAGEEPQELLIEALGPLRENQRWMLPRVRVATPDIFWLATRCGVNIYPPLRVRNLTYDQAVQVPARTEFDWADRELYVFQYFQVDAQIELEVVYSSPPIAANSAAQIDFGDNEIRGTVYLECSVAEGERYTLNFPLSEHWTVDSVIPYAPSILPGESEPAFSWDILDGTPQILSVQLDGPIRPRQPVMLQLSCRFSNHAQNQFRLAELFPLQFALRRMEQHHIAVRPNLTGSSLKAGMSASAFHVPAPLTFTGNTQVTLSGGTYPLDSRTQDILFELERTRASFTAEISGSIYVNDDGLIPTFHIRCSQIDPSVSRIHVHFTPFGEEETPDRWEWSLVSAADPSRPLRVQRISPDELRGRMTFSEQQNWNENLYQGEIWEIRFEELQYAPFEISATSLIPLADSMAIPLASVPLASSQQGELSILSPQQFNYRVVGGQHNSIPVAPPAWDRYQEVRAAFRYDPTEELRRTQHTPLLLQRLTLEEQVDTAWVWSLRLDTQYDSEGTVRNKALFLVENQGRGTLQITLPPGIDAENISAVWRDSQQIPWQYEAEQRTIDVALPAGQRFVSIALEYTEHQDLPLVQQRKLRPHYPEADVPILSGSWIAWFPPEFDVSLRRTAFDSRQEPAGPFVLSKALDYLLGSTYRSYLWAELDNAFYGKQRRIEAEAAAKFFFGQVVEVLQPDPLTAVPLSTVPVSTAPISTWGELLGNDKLLSTIRFQLAELAETRHDVVTRLLIDKQALTFLGITPATQIDNIALVDHTNVRETLFEQTGLVLLIAIRTLGDGSREYVLALTTPTTLSLDRRFPAVPSGHGVRIVPFEFFESASPSSPEWIPALRWMQETTLSSIPWSISAQVMQGTALTMDWNAYELSMDAEQPLYIVHRQKFRALQWLAFLVVVLLTCRKPFSTPVFLFVLLIVFELTARSVAPCYIGIPSGALLGVLVSFAFVLIRAQFLPRDPLPEPPPRDHSTEWSVSFVPTPLAARSVLLCGVLLGLSASALAQTFTEPRPASSGQNVLPNVLSNVLPKEPYRVFYLIDAEGQLIGEDVWLPWEFSLLLQNAQSSHPAISQRWHITKAVYQGSLVRSAQGILECADDFKAVYDIYLDSPGATITLPNLPAVPGRFLWNAQPIQPIMPDESTSETLSFLIENETPGIHTLEMTLSPKAVPRNADTTSMVSFTIPNVPQSTLRLHVPQDAPPVNVPSARGAVTVNNTLSPVVMAELGPTEQLSFSWIDDPNQSGTLVSEVEQFFWVRLKPLQNELEVLFRYHIEGGQIQQLTIQTDPRWSPSGQFRCAEGHQITTTDSSSYDSPYDVSVVEFSTPVSGTITLQRDFVLRTFDGRHRIFDGIGNLRLPEFRALQSQVSKSLLGISADPLFELDLPPEGRSGEFEAGWYGTPSSIAPPLFGNAPFWELAGEAFIRRAEASRERPLAAYDLAQTDPAWALNIRTKETIPDVTVTQSVLFDAHESRIHIVGVFRTVSPVFRQYFSTDQPIQIESFEVRNTQGNVVESRLQQIPTLTDPEQQTRLQQYVLFFKNPVPGQTGQSGQYTVTIRGFFETETGEDAPASSLPQLTFENAQMSDHSLNIFRTSAVIAEISPEQSRWVRSRAIPAPPEFFAPSRPLGTWQEDKSTDSDLPETEGTREPVPFAPLQFALSLNRPHIKSQTVLSLAEAHVDQWVMTLDFAADITGGDLESLTFHWDERCGVIQSIEPSTVNASLGTQGGQPVLTLSQTEPMQGELRVRMTVALNTAGATVSLPNVFPLDRNIDTLDSELLVDLPLRQGSEIIPWELHLLEAVDEPNAESSRAVYRVLDHHFTATISQAESRLTALFYDIGVLVMRDGTMTGSVTVDLRNRGQDSFILQMPSGYIPIQISSAGSIVNRTRLEGEGRWRIHIGTSDYPQRLNILFRALLSQPLRHWNREPIKATLHFPILEGVAVQDTLWTIAFEGNVPMLHVTSVLEQHRGIDTVLPLETTGSRMNNLNEHTPLSGRDAVLTLIGTNLIREHNLIRALDSIPVSVRQEEMQRWFLHWIEEWNTVADQVDFQHTTLQNVPLQNVRTNLILRPSGSAAERGDTPGVVRLFLETMNVGTREALRLGKDRSVTEKFGTATDTSPKQRVPILNSQVYWQGRISDEMQYLFGAEEGTIWEITLTSLPHESEWTEWLSAHIWLWTSLVLLLPIFVLLSVRWIHFTELWLQFPHFWGMTIGVVFWTFLPESFLGLIIITLTFASFFRPSWIRHRSTSQPF